MIRVPGIIFDSDLTGGFANDADLELLSNFLLKSVSPADES